MPPGRFTVRSSTRGQGRQSCERERPGEHERRNVAIVGNVELADRGSSIDKVDRGEFVYIKILHKGMYVTVG